MKNEKGVSLITLVITIIVVIILAAIALRGVGDTTGQAQFSSFQSEMGSLQDAVSVAIANAKGTEATRGNSRSSEQLANFVARGGYSVLLPVSGETGDEKWLVAADAKAIPCTIINREKANEGIKTTLPVRSVETSQNTNQVVSYYITPKGKVFCWPPYVFDGKSYVNSTTTAKDKDGNELDGVTATVKNTVVYITLEDNEKVAIMNKGLASADYNLNRGVSNVKGSGDNYESEGINIGVWYQSLSADNDTDDGYASNKMYYGVAEGYHFDAATAAYSNVN